MLVMFRHNGVVHAGHLGTDIAHPDNNAAVKDTWNTFATDNEDDVIGGFNPANDWPGGYPAQRRENIRPDDYRARVLDNLYLSAAQQ